MLDWIKINNNTYGVDMGFSMISVYVLPDGGCVLIDVGMEKGPELIEDLKAMDMPVRAVILTHAHVDHMSNVRFLKDVYDAVYYCPEIELNLPYMEFHFDHMKLGRDVFTPIPTGTRILEVCGVGFELIGTPGHTPGHISPITPDGVVCIGDALMSLDHLMKSKLPYMLNSDRAMESMRKLKNWDCPYFQFAHKGVCTRNELRNVIDTNLKNEAFLLATLRSLITSPMEIETLVTAFMTVAGLSERSINFSEFRDMARERIFSLVSAGEVRISNDGVVLPVKTPVI